MASFVVKQFGFVSGALADPINLTGSDQINSASSSFVICGYTERWPSPAYITSQSQELRVCCGTANM